MVANINDLEKLLTVSAACGNEIAYAQMLCQIVEDMGLGFCVSIDRINNVIVQTEKTNKPNLMLEVHFDEISLIVSEIVAPGFLKVKNVGGIDCRCLPACEVIVNGLHGIICSRPPHLFKVGEKECFPDIDGIYVDLGLDYDSISEKIQVGDRVHICAGVHELLNGRIAAKALDNKISVYTILCALNNLKDSILSNRLAYDLTILFASQEEIGSRGVKTGVYQINPDKAICIDVTFAAQPGVKYSPELGSGVVIEHSPFFDKKMTRNLIDLAIRHKIPYTVNVQAGASGTDGDIVPISCRGVSTAVLSIPQRNMHTPVEVCDMLDIESTVRLICAYVREGAY